MGGELILSQIIEEHEPIKAGCLYFFGKGECILG